MKTLKQFLKDKHPHDSNCLFAHHVVDLMHLLRKQTLKECAEKVTLSEDEIVINSIDVNSIEI